MKRTVNTGDITTSTESPHDSNTPADLPAEQTQSVPVLSHRTPINSSIEIVGESTQSPITTGEYSEPEISSRSTNASTATPSHKTNDSLEDLKQKALSGDAEAQFKLGFFYDKGPFYGRFERSLNTSRFASTLAITISSGVPILRALRTSRDTLSNAAMREQVEDATASVREGMSLARALAVHPHFPPMLIHMIRAGEVTGELPVMLNRAAQMQEQDLERRALTIASLLEPVLILTMGVLVLLIVLAVLMPIIEINQLVR